jgi:hypothetical protein
MLARYLPFVLLFSASIAAQQAQYGTPAAPHKESPARSQKVCPWLTEGSAAKALGGDVSVTVNVADTGEGSCKFTRQQDPSDSLDILISKAAFPTCPADSAKLQGIGNEAVLCKPPGSHSEAVEMVSSRVRDLHFTVTRASRRQKSTAKSTDAQEGVLTQIAEQVAGNLY